MYATINLPGSTHFHYYGPATKTECQSWLAVTVARLIRTELLTSLLPQRLVSNRTAERWRYLDGSKVFTGFFEPEKACWGAPTYVAGHFSCCTEGE